MLRSIVHDTSKTAKITWFILVLHLAVDRSPYIHGPVVRPGRSCEKKSITRTGQDRTGQQKSHKSVIFHIFGEKAPRKDIAMKFGTGVDVPEAVTWAEFDL